jgi:large subunit ribosomal protein L13
MASVTNQEKIVVIDGKDLILGRLGSVIAKRLLLGETIKLVNCKDVVILGRKRFLVEKYKGTFSRTVTYHGPYYSRSPADIVRRSMRKMLPYRNARGANAYKKLKCFTSVPSTLLSATKESVESAQLDADSVFYYTKIGEICKALGYAEK